MSFSSTMRELFAFGLVIGFEWNAILRYDVFESHGLCLCLLQWKGKPRFSFAALCLFPPNPLPNYLPPRLTKAHNLRESLISMLHVRQQVLLPILANHPQVFAGVLA